MIKHKKIILSSVLATLIITFTSCVPLDDISWDLDTQKIVLNNEIDLSVQDVDSELEEEKNDDVNEQESANYADYEEEASGANDTFLVDTGYHFAYDQLNDEQKIWYEDIANILGTMGEDVELSDSVIEKGLSEDNIDLIFQCVMIDHPELFYVEGYSYVRHTRGDKIVKYEFTGNYSMDRQQAAQYKARIEENTLDVIKHGLSLSDDYEKIKYVYEKIVHETDYSLEAANNQNIYSVFINHESVCQGYAKAMQYLLNRMNVECTLVQGHVENGEGHAWNLVNSNGNYYYVDVTWADASYFAEDNSITQSYPEINYDYLNITYEEISKTHTADYALTLPACISMNDNYYVREGTYFEYFDDEKMRRVFDEAYETGKDSVLIKCEDMYTYDEIFIEMIDNQAIFSYLKGDYESVSYGYDEARLTMTFWVTN